MVALTPNSLTDLKLQKQLFCVPSRLGQNPNRLRPAPSLAAPEPSLEAPEPSMEMPIPCMVAPIASMVRALPSMVAPIPCKVAPVPSMVRPVPCKVAPVPSMVRPIPCKVALVPSMVAPIPGMEFRFSPLEPPLERLIGLKTGLEARKTVDMSSMSGGGPPPQSLNTAEFGTPQRLDSEGSSLRRSCLCGVQSVFPLGPASCRGSSSGGLVFGR